MSIRIGILGYGNLGKGVESAIGQNPDLELTAVFTRRNPENVNVRTAGVKVLAAEELEHMQDQIDVLVLCGGSVSGIVDARTTTKEQIGLMMTKHSTEVM